MAAFTLNYNPAQLPDYRNLTPAQNAKITQILQANGVLPTGYSPQVYSSPCDPAYLATIPAANQAYAQQLCAMGISGYNLGNGLYNYDATQAGTGIAQLPSSLAAAASFAAQPVVDAAKSLLNVPWWVWAALAALGVVIVIDIVK